MMVIITDKYIGLRKKHDFRNQNTIKTNIILFNQKKRTG
jgi:hypothetical protein